MINISCLLYTAYCMCASIFSHGKLATVSNETTKHAPDLLEGPSPDNGGRSRVLRYLWGGMAVVRYVCITWCVEWDCEGVDC